LLAADGNAVYDTLRMACHASGVAGAQKFGDAKAWAARTTQGKQTLNQHSLNSFQGAAGSSSSKRRPRDGQGMAKRGFINLSDAEVFAALDHTVAAVDDDGSITAKTVDRAQKKTATVSRFSCAWLVEAVQATKLARIFLIATDSS